MIICIYSHIYLPNIIHVCVYVWGIYMYVCIYIYIYIYIYILYRYISCVCVCAFLEKATCCMHLCMHMYTYIICIIFIYIYIHHLCVCLCVFWKDNMMHAFIQKHFYPSEIETVTKYYLSLCCINNISGIFMCLCMSDKADT